jgi:hypothetical protein
MVTLEQLYEGVVRLDAMGDIEGVRALGEEIVRRRQQSSGGVKQEQSPEVSAAPATMVQTEPQAPIMSDGQMPEPQMVNLMTSGGGIDSGERSQTQQMVGGALRGAGDIGAGALAGGMMAGPPGALAGAAAVALTNPTISLINNLFGTNYTRPEEAMQHLFTQIGVPKADTEAARMVQAMSRGAAEGVAQVGVGKALQMAASPVVRGIGETLASQPAQQIAGSTGAAGGAQAAQEMGLGAVGQVAGALAGGALGSISQVPELAKKAEIPLTEIAIKASRGNKVAMEDFAKRAISDPKMQKAASELGLSLSPELLASDPQYLRIAQAVASAQNSRLGIQQQEQLFSIGKRASKLIEEMGGSADFSEISEKVKSTMQATHSSIKSSEDLLWNELREIIPPKTPAAPTSTMDAINKAASEFGGVEKLGKMETAILNDLKPKRLYDTKGDFIGIELPTYSLLERRRQEIGEASRGTGPFSDAGIGLAKKYYALLSEDAARVADAVGAGEISKQAKSLTTQRKDLEDRLTSLFGEQLNKSLSTGIRSATNALKNGDVDALSNILTSSPKELRQEIVATGLSEAFGKFTQSKGELNFDKFYEWWSGIEKNKRAKALIMSNLPIESRRNLQSIADLSAQVSKVLSLKLGTGKILDAMKVVERPMEKVSKAAKNVALGVAVGAPVEAIAGAVGLGGNGIGYAVTGAVTGAMMAQKSAPLQAADELMMSPKFQNMIREMAKKYPNGATKAEAELIKSPEFKKFADSINLSRSARATFFAADSEPSQESEK